MKRSELTELHYITPIANISSILRLGILSHNRAVYPRIHLLRLAPVVELRGNRISRRPIGFWLWLLIRLWFFLFNC
jgi:hypothetical protein